MRNFNNLFLFHIHWILYSKSIFQIKKKNSPKKIIRWIYFLSDLNFINFDFKILELIKRFNDQKINLFG